MCGDGIGPGHVLLAQELHIQPDNSFERAPRVQNMLDSLDDDLCCMHMRAAFVGSGNMCLLKNTRVKPI